MHATGGHESTAVALDDGDRQEMLAAWEALKKIDAPKTYAALRRHVARSRR